MSTLFWVGEGLILETALHRISNAEIANHPNETYIPCSRIEMKYVHIDKKSVALI